MPKISTDGTVSLAATLTVPFSMAVAEVDAFRTEAGTGGVAARGGIAAELLVEDVNSAISVSPWDIADNSAIPSLFSFPGLIFGVKVAIGGDWIADIEGCFLGEFEIEGEVGGAVPVSS